MKPEIRKIEEPSCSLFSEERKYVGEINSYLSLLDVRAQIKELGLTGYYLVYLGHKICIDRNGELEEYPKGFFDQTSNFLLKLI